MIGASRRSGHADVFLLFRGLRFRVKRCEFRLRLQYKVSDLRNFLVKLGCAVLKALITGFRVIRFRVYRV